MNGKIASRSKRNLEQDYAQRIAVRRAWFEATPIGKLIARLRPASLGLSGSLIVFFGATITSLILMSGLYLSLGPSSQLGWQLSAVWLVATAMLLVTSEIHGRKVSSWWRAQGRPVVSLLVAVLFGVFHGGMLFSLWMIDGFSQRSMLSMDVFSQVEKHLRAPDKESAESRTWFDEQGRLLPEHATEWCAQAMPRIETFQAFSRSGEPWEVDAVLLRRLYGRAYGNGCMTQQAWLDQLRQGYNFAVSNPSRGQVVMEKLSWFPVFHVLVPARQMILEKLVPSPAFVCKALAENELAGPSRIEALMPQGCAAHFDGHRVVEEKDIKPIGSYIQGFADHVQPVHRRGKGRG